MEERKSYGMVVLFVSVFVVFLVSIMSYSLWRDRQVNAFMTTNRAWGIQCDTVSQAAWVIRDGERVDLQIIHKPDTAHAENKDHTLNIITPRCPFDGIPGEINHRRYDNYRQRQSQRKIDGRMFVKINFHSFLSRYEYSVLHRQPYAAR